MSPNDDIVTKLAKRDIAKMSPKEVGDREVPIDDEVRKSPNGGIMMRSPNDYKFGNRQTKST